MLDQAVPDRGDPDAQLAEAHAGLLKAAADLRELHEKFRGLLATTTVLGEIVRTHEQLVAEQRRQIAALQASLAIERGRRMRPKSERDSSKPARRA